MIEPSPPPSLPRASRAPGADVQLEGRVLGGTYRVERRLDEGGMGKVFEATHLRLNRKVAVKVLSPELAASPAGLARFQQEAELVSQIAHPHVVTVLDFDVSEQGEPYLVLELLGGETLAQRLERTSPLALEEAVSITVQAASGLAAAHRAAIVHRDLKPPNIFLVGDGDQPLFVKLLDFGIGKRLRGTRHITLADQVLGTPEYMAPEQATGRVDLVSARTDQYALAVVLYEMVTGLQPFAHDDIGETLKRVTTLVPAPASSASSWVPDALDAVLARALSKSPEDRFASVTAFATAVADAAGLEPGPDAVSERPPRPPKLPRETRPSAPPDPSAEGSLAHWIERTRHALVSSDPEEAASLAERAFDVAMTMSDEASLVALRVSEPVLAQAFLRRLGSAKHRVYPSRTKAASEFPLSPRAAYLLSRLDEDMSVEEALDVSGMPRLETLRTLVQLVRCGAIRTGGVAPH